MAGELTPHEGGLAPDEEYDGYLFADASFADADAGNGTSSTASSPASPSTAAG